MKHDQIIFHMLSQESGQVTTAIVYGSELERLDERWDWLHYYTPAQIC